MCASSRPFSAETHPGKKSQGDDAGERKCAGEEYGECSQREGGVERPAQGSSSDPHQGQKYEGNDRGTKPSKSRRHFLDRPPGHVDPTEPEQEDRRGQDEEESRGYGSARAVHEPPKIRGQLLCLGAREQHAKVESVKETTFRDPTAAFDHFLVHDRDLSGRTSKADAPELGPKSKRLGERHAKGTRAGRGLRRQEFRTQFPSLRSLRSPVDAPRTFRYSPRFHPLTKERTMAKNIASRATDSAQWYLDVIKAAQLADYSPVRGCMVIRPEGFALWEAIQRDLDRRFKETGHVNAYFPLLIPASFLAKEAQHIDGFAMECAVVTHSKLQRRADGEGLVPAGELEEPLVIRPTSETMIGHMYAQWIQSYRDLPVLINQWANVMRWEMRTRLFLRTAEFLWQEGHTAHETAEEAREETLRMLDVYAAFAEEFLAIPVIKGRKTDTEKFPGADVTYAIEGMMQDGKALQCGTSHDLGQNFARAFEIKFLGRDQKEHLVHTTSWGVSTRLIGALIMAHSDDDGLVIPPRVAPIVAAIVPIYKTDDERAKVATFVGQLLDRLTSGNPAGGARRTQGEITSVFTDAGAHQKIIADWRDNRPGDKHFHWEQRGVPFRIEVGPRDVDAGAFVLKHRLNREKETMALGDATPAWLAGKLRAMHEALFTRALAMREARTHRVDSYDELKRILETEGGFVRCYFEPGKEAEAKIKEETKATVRCIPLEQPNTPGRCIFSGRETSTEVLFAQAY